MHSNTDTQQRNPGRLPFDVGPLVLRRIIGFRPGSIQHPLGGLLLCALQLFDSAPVHIRPAGWRGGIRCAPTAEKLGGPGSGRTTGGAKRAMEGWRGGGLALAPLLGLCIADMTPTIQCHE
jgi:hypothetical protein